MAKKSIALLFLILIALPTMFSCASCFDVPYAEVEVSGNEVENSVNNYLSGGSLVRIGDSLYYGYEKNALSHGIIKISSFGSERIYYGGDYTLQPGQPATPNLMDYNSKLVAGMDKWHEWRYYSFDSAKFEKYESLPETEIFINSVFQPMKDNIAFPYYDLGEFDDENGVFNSESKIILVGADGEEIDVISDNSRIFYVAGELVFYSEYNADDGSYSIIKYNVNDKSEVEVVRVDNYSVYKIYVEGNYLILFGYSNSVLLVDLESENPELTTAVSCSDIEADPTEYYDINVYGGKIYVAWKSNGLYTYNIGDGKLSKLCDAYAEECYIVDDYWVYFVGEESSLWRVAQDGSVVERVYG